VSPSQQFIVYGANDQFRGAVSELQTNWANLLPCYDSRTAENANRGQFAVTAGEPPGNSPPRCVLASFFGFSCSSVQLPKRRWCLVERELRALSRK
jgi:hypothetical protein